MESGREGLPPLPAHGASVSPAGVVDLGARAYKEGAAFGADAGKGLFLMYSLLVLIAGMLQSAMMAFDGLLSDRIGLFGVSLMVHASGGLLLAFYILLFVRKKITLRGMPWYLYSAGFFGALLVSVSSYCVGILGAAATTCLSVAGQLVISAVIDHYGLFHVPKVPFSVRRIPCFLLILAGVFLLNLA